MVHRKKTIYLFCSSLLVLAACGGKTSSSATQTSVQTSNQKPVMEPEKQARKEAVSLPEQSSPPERIAPGSCRLEGKVLSVLPNLEPDKTTPCGQVPCRAVVKVQQILGYGSAFGKPLAKNQEINVYFAFTLSPANQYFPELTTAFPGLKTGDVFVADVTRGGEVAENKAAWYQVYDYRLKK